MKPETDVNQETGEVVTVTPFTKAPMMIGAKTVNELAGKNTTFMNLRDHPELDNVKLAIVAVQVNTGEYGDWVKIYGYFLDGERPTDPVVIMTGSENVMGRALTIAPLCSWKTPVIGTLKRAGERAWSLD